MATPIQFLTDFPDRISPMLVKELRQGMRAKTFIAVFLSLQIFLGVMLLSASLASSSDQVGDLISGIIFTFFAIAVILVQPLRGTSALSSEVKGNTIDMMVLTRLSAWRIVTGKWVAIVGQSALLFSTIIPYLILRYFFGGMNLVGEIVCIILIFMTSMALTAMTVGLSGCSSVIIRSVGPLLGIPALIWMVAEGYREFHNSGLIEFLSLDSEESKYVVAAYVAGIAYVGASFLSLGASLIAPAAENHAIVRRVFALLVLLVIPCIGFLTSFNEPMLVLMTAIVAGPAIIIALTESSPLVSTVCKPFVRRGAIGRALGLILYPCWSSGALYAMLISLISFLGIGITFDQFSSSGLDFNSRMGIEEWIVVMSLSGGLFFPSVWQVFLFRGDGQRVAHYLLLLLGSFIVLAVFMALADSMGSGNFLWFFVWNPLTFLAMMEEDRINREVILVGVCIVNLVIFGILFTRALMELKQYLPVFREAESTLENES
jgi:hypothetical protein